MLLVPLAIFLAMMLAAIGGHRLAQRHVSKIPDEGVVGAGAPGAIQTIRVVPCDAVCGRHRCDDLSDLRS
jgi:hypothetical protein